MRKLRHYSSLRKNWHWVAGFLATGWLLLRSITKPQRLTYPCQQAAMPLAVNWILAIITFFAGSVALKRFTRMSAVVIVAVGGIWLVGSLSESSRSATTDILSLPVWEVDDPVSELFVLDSIPLTSGSLAPGDDSVPDEYLTDPAIDSLLAIMASRGLYIHRTESQPDGIVASDDVVIIKGNYQWAGRNVTDTDRVKGLIWQILNHPDGFTGEIIVCDNTQDVGTGINDDDNNSDDREQSLPDVVNTFFAKGYPVYYLCWAYIWDIVTDEYSEGDYRDGYVYEVDTKISYPKFRSPSQDYFLSMRNGIWDFDSSEYDSTRLCIIDFPVLKAHIMAGATVGVKNWIGMLTTAHANQRYGNWNNMHYNYFWGTYSLVARVMEVTLPRLTIVDADWTSTYNPNDTMWLEETNMLLASTDPVAVSWYGAKFILTPIARYPNYTDPDLNNSLYNRSLSNWENYFRNGAGLPFTMDSSEISVFDRGIITGIDKEKNPLPVDFAVYQNYPNPFNASTVIQYDLPVNSDIIVDIYDILGRRIESITINNQTAGRCSYTWDATDYPSGVYLYKITAAGYSDSNKMLLLK
ncbi:MAG: DUF362 domain-containing protein [candidate division Zixibacteria bacterium]